MRLSSARSPDSVSAPGSSEVRPTAVFAGKLTTATAAWDGGAAWLAVAEMLVRQL